MSARESLMMLSLPNSGSTWLGEQISKHSRWNRYYPEFFNPLRNTKHYDVLAPRFGCELIDCYRNIAAGGGSSGFDSEIDRTWGVEDLNFTKEVFSPFKLEAFSRRFKCFVLLRSREDTFPPKRLRIWSFYEHAWWAMTKTGIDLGGDTAEARALAAHRRMYDQLEADAARLGVPVLYYRDLFGDDVREKLAAAIGECPFGLLAAIEDTRVLFDR